MTDELENRLRTLFQDAEIDLPGEAFTARVMSELRSRRRRENSIWSLAFLAGVGCLWLVYPDLEPVLGTIAVYPRVLMELAIPMVGVVAESPLTYIYGAAFGGYLLMRILPRLRIRLA